MDGTLIVVTDGSWHEIAAIDDYDLDAAIGDDENDFSLAISGATPPGFGERSLWFIDGTEWGGIVDRAETERTRSGTVVTYSGRTWSGILQARVVVPPSGQSHYCFSGDAHSCIMDLIGKLGLQGIFTSPLESSGIEVDYQFERFDDAWHGLVSALASSGAKPVLRRRSGLVYICAEPVFTWGDEVDSDLVDFTIERNWRPVNHLVCVGEGELENRTVIHLFADADGNVSGAQTQFGADEVVELYDYSSANADELEEAGRKRLGSYQVNGSVDVTFGAPEGGFSYRDIVVGRENRFGIEVSAEVVRKTASGTGGPIAIEYETGSATVRKASTSGGSSGGSLSGGHAYYAGEGLTLNGWTFSAEVTSKDIERLENGVEEARTASLNAVESAAKAVASVCGDGFITAKREGQEVSIGAQVVTPDEVRGWFY